MYFNYSRCAQLHIAFSALFSTYIKSPISFLFLAQQYIPSATYLTHPTGVHTTKQIIYEFNQIQTREIIKAGSATYYSQIKIGIMPT